MNKSQLTQKCKEIRDKNKYKYLNEEEIEYQYDTVHGIKTIQTKRCWRIAEWRSIKYTNITQENLKKFQVLKSKYVCL